MEQTAARTGNTTSRLLSPCTSPTIISAGGTERFTLRQRLLRNRHGNDVGIERFVRTGDGVISMPDTFNDLPHDIRDNYRIIRPNDYETAAASNRIPALGNRTLLE